MMKVIAEEEEDDEDQNVWNASAVILDIDSGSWADLSPLHEAAARSRLLTVSRLLSQGNNVNVLTVDHVAPLHEACLRGNTACARLLIAAGANVNVCTIDGVTPLFNAASAGSLSCMQLLLESGAKPQGEGTRASPIHQAAREGYSRCVETLVAWGADVNLYIPHMGTPLYVACMWERLHCVRALLSAGADVHQGRLVESPLHAAARRDSPHLVEVLLEFGANVNALNEELKFPAEVAPPGSVTEQMLLQHQATPRPLKQLCRLTIRACMGHSRMGLLSHLRLPDAMHGYLLYR